MLGGAPALEPLGMAGGALDRLSMVQEDDGLLLAERQQKTGQSRQLVFARAGNGVEIDAMVGRFMASIVDADGMCHVDKTGDGLGIGCGEEHAPANGRHTADKLLHLGLKSHFKTFVELVDDECMHGADVDILLVDVVVQTSGSAKNDMGLELTHLAMLIHRRTTSVAGHAPESASHGSHDVDRLQGKFTTRHDHNALQLTAFGGQTFYKREQVGKRLT